MNRDEDIEMVANIIRYADKSENPVLIPESLKEDYRKAAEAILNLPQIAVISDDQSLPQVEWTEGKYVTHPHFCIVNNACRETQQIMIDAGWKRVERPQYGRPEGLPIEGGGE